MGVGISGVGVGRAVEVAAARDGSAVGVDVGDAVGDMRAMCGKRTLGAATGAAGGTIIATG